SRPPKELRIDRYYGDFEAVIVDCHQKPSGQERGGLGACLSDRFSVWQGHDRRIIQNAVFRDGTAGCGPRPCSRSWMHVKELQFAMIRRELIDGLRLSFPERIGKRYFTNAETRTTDRAVVGVAQVDH